MRVFVKQVIFCADNEGEGRSPDINYKKNIVEVFASYHEAVKSIVKDEIAYLESLEKLGVSRDYCDGYSFYRHLVSCSKYEEAHNFLVSALREEPGLVAGRVTHPVTHPIFSIKARVVAGV